MMTSRRQTRSRGPLGSPDSDEIQEVPFEEENDAQDTTYYGMEEEEEEEESDDYKDEDTTSSESSDFDGNCSDSPGPSTSSSNQVIPTRRITPTISRRGRPRKKDSERRGRHNSSASLPTTSTAQTDTPKARNKIQRWKGGTGQTGRPAELFRTDFITAMKVNENETFLDMSRCFIISDPWRQEWNNGVQVPVHHSSPPPIRVRPLSHAPLSPTKPGNKKPTYVNPKYRRLTKDEFFHPEEHQFSATFKRAEEACRYDLDDTDVRWLSDFNQELTSRGLERLEEREMEEVIECLEMVCYDNIQQAALQAGIRTERQQREDDAACDVCLQDESELDDQIVFCDQCDMAVHQSCYGTGPLPEGTWICRACRISPSSRQRCLLCPNKGGALKSTRSGEKWAHVACVWWIPEVRFESPEMMEPVIHISKIPADRWSLKCVLCRKMEGACIQCSEKACLAAYHVTCGQKHGLYMKMHPAKQQGDLKLQSYCPKHHRDPEGVRAPYTPPPSPVRARPGSVLASTSKSSSDLTSLSPRKVHQRRRRELEAAFFDYVTPEGVAASPRVNVSLGIVKTLYHYWKLKRQKKDNRSLLTPKQEEDKLLKEHEEKEYTRLIKMLITLRQNLEKARNLCYMVVKARKQEMQYRKVMEEQLDVLAGAAGRPDISKRDFLQLAKYLEPVPGTLGVYERRLRGLDPQTPEVKTEPVSHSPLDGRVEEAPGQRGEEEEKRGGEGQWRVGSPVGAQVAVSPKTAMTPDMDRDRNFNLSPIPTMRKAEAAPGNMSWNGELNGLVSVTGKKRKAPSPNGLWRDSVLPVLPGPDKRPRLSPYSTKLRSKGAREDAGPK